MEQIVDMLKERRVEAGVTIKELAYKMKTSPARVSEIEHGKGGLTLKKLLAYANALGLSVTIKFE